jgi:phage gpG-like protein
MSRVSVQWYGDERVAEMVAAADRALEATAEFVGREVRKSLKQYQNVIGKTPTGRNVYRSSPPGTPPGWRTGRLARSITTRRAGALRYQIGTNLEYAAIHEFGGTINHPGGTAFMSVGNSRIGAVVFVSNKAAKEMEKATGQKLRRTAPHTISMPKRPFLIPTIQRMSADGSLQERFNTRFKANTRSLQ